MKDSTGSLCAALLVFGGCVTSNPTNQSWTKQGASFSRYKVIVVRLVVDGTNQQRSLNDETLFTPKLANLIGEHLKKREKSDPPAVTMQESSPSALLVEAKEKSYAVGQPLSIGTKAALVSGLLVATAVGCITCPVTLVTGPDNVAVAELETTLSDHQTDEVLARIDERGAATRNGWSESPQEVVVLRNAAMSDTLDRTADDIARRFAP